MIVDNSFQPKTIINYHPPFERGFSIDQLALIETSSSLGRVWFCKVIWDRDRGRECRSCENNIEESHLLKLGKKFE